ncbi:MoxR family ATPase [Notoacmeibacter sp. MSK16QG-6]|uniref:AAA family ATPase n=1 Tax=Notoacmeibacter sp. MSK16QG-6 TaxID=2957982 RepID=UPI00209EE751|nr:MoxR family ATPase [Notoacmeibacter sp. MSK16QG-6]MCP1200499.1 MoxR family ATPase [Notoacmeibacter sp. MSK16QG-6]
MAWQKLQGDLADTGYVASDDLAMALYLAVTLGKPLLLEGPAGVGKTQIAKTLAEFHDTRLIRLQCYEGLDASHAIYEWNYQRQLLSIRAAAEEHRRSDEIEDHIFSEKFLLKRPLLEAIRQERPAVLLIDEIDRADEEFEAYLLEILSDFQITIPEIGTIEAKTRPHVILTANGARDLSDALRRRCLYSYVDYPDRKTELAILARRRPDLEDRLAEQIVGFVQALRKEELEKNPGIAEVLDWAAALAGLGVNDLADNPEQTQATLVCLLKTERDRAAVPKEVQQRLAGKAA